MSTQRRPRFLVFNFNTRQIAIPAIRDVQNCTPRHNQVLFILRYYPDVT
ncbi:hypothetical protein L0128_18225 [candidate division KSB1 bacterium]|nr:hypothetical protein [candidate division KSB1 bacterium]